MVGEKKDEGRKLEIGTSTKLSLVFQLNQEIKLRQCSLFLMDNFRWEKSEKNCSLPNTKNLNYISDHFDIVYKCLQRRVLYQQFGFITSNIIYFQRPFLISYDHSLPGSPHFSVLLVLVTIFHSHWTMCKVNLNYQIVQYVSTICSLGARR